MKNETGSGDGVVTETYLKEVAVTPWTRDHDEAVVLKFQCRGIAVCVQDVLVVNAVAPCRLGNPRAGVDGCHDWRTVGLRPSGSKRILGPREGPS